MTTSRMTRSRRGNLKIKYVVRLTVAEPRDTGEDAQQRPGQAGSDLWERLDPFGASYRIAGHCTEWGACAPHEAMDCSERLASGHADRSQKALPTHSGQPGKAQGLADVAAKI